MAGQKVERERRDLAPRIEGLFVQHHALAEQQIGERTRQIVEVGGSRDNRR